MADINATQSREKYLNSSKAVNIRDHLNKLEKEEKSNLKGIEIRSTVKQLGKNDFLQLLITQLSHQDPTAPVKDQDFIAQMAQFSSLEQMTNMTGAINKMGSRQSYSLVGKVVSGPDLVTGENIVGVAGALFFDGEGKSYVRVNGRSVEVDAITLISDPSIINTNTMNAPGADTNAQPAANAQTPVSPEVKSQGKTESSPVVKQDTVEKSRNDWDFPGKRKEIIEASGKKENSLDAAEKKENKEKEMR